MPGISGATSTPARDPRPVQLADRLERARGLGVCGSARAPGPLVERRDGEVDGELRRPRRSPEQLRSRSTSGDFVTSDAGVPESRSAAQMPGISR